MGRTEKSWDRWLGVGHGLMGLVSLGIALVTGTAVWGRIADALLG